MSVIRLMIAGVLVAAVAAISAGPAEPYQSVDDFLRSGLKFSRQELEAVKTGRAAAQSVSSRDNHTIAAAGLIGLTSTPEALVTRLRDIEHFKSDAAVLQIGKFSSTPAVEDLEHLTWESEDLRAFRNCRPSRCDVRLTADAMTRFRSDVDWSSDGRNELASRTASRLLVELSQAYLDRGDSALSDYRDRDQPVNPAREFRALAMASPSPLDFSPEFRDYMIEFPRRSLPGVENFLYWSKEKVAFHAVVSVTHVAIYTPPTSSPFALMVCSRQVYASRYFDASLGMTTMFTTSEPDRTNASFRLLYLNRSRTDELLGLFGGLKRAVVRSRAVSAMQKYLVLLRTRLEPGGGRQARLHPAPSAVAGARWRDSSRRPGAVAVTRTHGPDPLTEESTRSALSSN